MRNAPDSAAPMRSVEEVKAMLDTTEKGGVRNSIRNCLTVFQYDSPGPVSHVGIYVGDGMMLHCGSPIQYANINSSYWQTHFYAFGRL